MNRPALPLSTEQVFLVVAARAATEPVSTSALVDLCRAAYPGVAEITTPRMYQLLKQLRRAGRVVSTREHGWAFWQLDPLVPPPNNERNDPP